MNYGCSMQVIGYLGKKRVLLSMLAWMLAVCMAADAGYAQSNRSPCVGTPNPYEARGPEVFLHALDTTNDPTIRACMYRSLGIYYQKFAADSSLKYSDQGLELAQSLGVPRLTVMCLNVKASAWITQGKYEGALRLLMRAQNISDSIGYSVGKTSSQGRMARIYAQRGENLKALRLEQAAYKGIRQREDTVNLAISMQNQGLLYMRMDSFAQSKHMLDRSRAILLAHGDTNLMAESWMHTGYLLLETKQTQKAQQAFRRSMNLAHRVGSDYLQALNLHNLGKVFQRLDRDQRAWGEPSSVLNLPEMRKRTLDSAIFYHKRALRRATSLSYPALEKEICRFLKIAYKDLGNLDSFARYYDRYHDQVIALNDLEKEKVIARLEAKMESAAKDQAIQELRLREQKQSHRQRLLWAGLLAMFVVVSLSTLGYRRQQHINRRLQQKNQEVEAMQREKESLTGMIVHDLKNPLANILALSELEPGASGMAMVRQSAQKMMRQVKTILDVQQATYGGLSIRPQWIDLKPVVEEEIAQLQLIAQGRGIAIQMDVPDRIAVYADEDGLRRILGNLLDNAVKYTPAKGHIGIAFHSENDGHDDHQDVITVWDTGLGVPAEDQKRIFEPYITGPKRSSGLGLAFCKMMTEAHGGSMGLASGAQQGSRFWLKLPHPKREPPRSSVNPVTRERPYPYSDA